eukprot:jgi/Botrbrau1/12795/Bobra.117_1s0014.1
MLSIVGPISPSEVTLDVTSRMYLLGAGTDRMFLRQARIMAHRVEGLYESISLGHSPAGLGFLTLENAAVQMYKNGTVYNNASALAWTRHVAEGLRYLHNAKPQVVHRDLKLENVLMRNLPDGKKEACLADFGLSALLKGGREETQNEKSEFISVTKGEHIKNKELEDLQHAVEATLKTSDKTIAGGYRRPLPDYWPEELTSLISDCWAQEPASRPSMDEVCARLKAIQESGIFDPKDPPGWNKKALKRRAVAKAADVSVDNTGGEAASTGCSCSIM